MSAVDELILRIDSLRSNFSSVFRSSGWSENIPLSSLFGSDATYINLNLVQLAMQDTVALLRNASPDQVTALQLDEFIPIMIVNIDYLTSSTITTNPTQALYTALEITSAINFRIETTLPKPPFYDWESVKDKDLMPKYLSRRLTSIESTLSALEPRAVDLDRKITEIDTAHATAEQLPMDLQALREANYFASNIVESAKQHLEEIARFTNESRSYSQTIASNKVESDKLIQRSEQALRGATGVGLAAAFDQRKKELGRTLALWVLGLVASLTIALFIGANRVEALKDVLTNDRATVVIIVNALLAAIGVAAPVWFAWLSTKQIGSLSKLSEDYAFKASVSKAYEGYRKEAVGIDAAMQKRLFSSTLSRLEEAPIRLIDAKDPGSPLHELLSNPSLMRSLEAVPEVYEKIIALIPGKAGAAAVIAPAAAVATVATATHDATDPPEKT